MNNQKNIASGAESPEQPHDGNRKVHPLVRFFEALGVVCLIFLLPVLYLIEGLIELKDMIVEGEHYLPNGRGRN